MNDSFLDKFRLKFSHTAHALRVRREKWSHAIVRMRLRREQRVEKPMHQTRSAISSAGGRVHRWLGTFSGLTIPFVRMRTRMRSRVDAARDLTAPLRSRAAQTAEQVGSVGSRWWDPIYVKLQPYLQTRLRGDLLRGLPALIVILIILAGVVLVTGIRPSVTGKTQLLRYAELAMSNKEYSKAAIAYQRMLQIGNADPEIRLGLARCWALLGERDQAQQLLSLLAPDNSVGYAPAHRIRAFIIMEMPDAAPEQLNIARRHLESALAVNPTDAETHGMMATLLLRQNNLPEAREHYIKAAAAQPAMMLNAAIISQKLNDDVAVADYAARASAYFRALMHDESKATTETKLSFAQSLCLQKEYDEALDIVQTIRTSSEDLNKMTLEICVAWAAALDADKDSPHDLESMRVTRAALLVVPDDPAWQVRLLNLTGGNSSVRPAAVDLLERLAREKHAGAEACFFLGMEAWSHKNPTDAQELFERSYMLKPDHAPTANNLACALMEGLNPDLERALKLSNQAVTATPKNPMYRETRGEILLAMHRWPDAAADFEASIPGLRSRRDAREHLAYAYEQMGHSEAAREQLRLAVSDQSE